MGNAVMFEPLDDWWDKMTQQNVGFKGFWYRSRSEAATWFMMSRRGNEVSRNIVKHQVAASSIPPSGCPIAAVAKKLCYGSHMVSWGLCKASEEYCKCYKTDNYGCDLHLAKQDETSSVNIDFGDPRGTVQSRLSRSSEDNPDNRQVEWPPFATRSDDREAWSEFKNAYTKHKHKMPFITIDPGDLGVNAQKQEDDLLAMTDTFFRNWLCLAGVEVPDVEC